MNRTPSIDMSSGVAAGTAPAFLDNDRCPVCGASAVEGGCSDSAVCANVLGRLESTDTYVLVGALAARQSAEVNGLWSAMLLALDSLAVGLAICDTSAKILAVNATAERTLANGDALHVSESGELCTVARNAPVLADSLKRLESAGSNDTLPSQGKALLIPRKSGGRPITVLMRRVNTGLTHATSMQVVVMIMDATLAVGATTSDLQQLFGFTPGETRLANLLMSGVSMADSCRELGICLSTGCSHLRKIFKKTKTHRQGELVALLLRIGLLRNRIPVSAFGEERQESSKRNDVRFSGLIQVDVDSDL
jgi:DNA-binding CsgD family transcriptional regulator